MISAHTLGDMQAQLDAFWRKMPPENRDRFVFTACIPDVDIRVTNSDGVVFGYVPTGTGYTMNIIEALTQTYNAEVQGIPDWVRIHHNMVRAQSSVGYVRVWNCEFAGAKMLAVSLELGGKESEPLCYLAIRKHAREPLDVEIMQNLRDLTLEFSARLVVAYLLNT